MKAIGKGGEKSYALNDKKGIINLNGENGIGMKARGKGATIENRGTINLSGSISTLPIAANEYNDNHQTGDTAVSNISFIGRDNKGNIGMKVEDGAKMINKGKITFKN